MTDLEKLADRIEGRGHTLIAAIMWGVLAAMVAHNLGIEWWRTDPGDAADIGLTTAFAIYWTIRAAIRSRSKQ